MSWTNQHIHKFLMQQLCEINLVSFGFQGNIVKELKLNSEEK